MPELQGPAKASYATLNGDIDPRPPCLGTTWFGRRRLRYPDPHKRVQARVVGIPFVEKGRLSRWRWPFGGISPQRGGKTRSFVDRWLEAGDDHDGRKHTLLPISLQRHPQAKGELELQEAPVCGVASASYGLTLLHALAPIPGANFSSV
jgi:hypothetical protein